MSPELRLTMELTACDHPLHPRTLHDTTTPLCPTVCYSIWIYECVCDACDV